MVLTHGQLVTEARSGSKEALDALMRRHLPRVAAYVHLHARPALRARESTMDLVQSACRELLRDLPAAGAIDEAEFRRWLYLAAERKILDRARYWAREKRRAENERSLSVSKADAKQVLAGCANLFTPSQDAIAHEELTRFERAFHELPEPYRDVILFCKLLDFSYADAAQQMGRTQDSVRMLLHRALARLARLLEPVA